MQLNTDIRLLHTSTAPAEQGCSSFLFIYLDFDLYLQLLLSCT